MKAQLLPPIKIPFSNLNKNLRHLVENSPKYRMFVTQPVGLKADELEMKRRITFLEDLNN